MPIDKSILRKLNSKVIFTQCLVKSATGSASLVEVSDALCGVNSQNFRDSYMTYWARASGFNEKKLISSIKPSGALSRTWTVRGTVHTFPTRDYSTHVFGGPVERALKAHDRYARQLGLPASRLERVKRLYGPLLDEIGNSKVSTDFVNQFISSRLEEMGIRGQRALSRGWSKERIMGPTWEGVMEMSYMGILSNAGRKGSGNLWMSTRHWLGSSFKHPDYAESATSLVKKYIQNYGPVTFSDIAYWTGHRKDFLKPILEDLESDIKILNLGETREKYYSIDELDSDYQKPPHALILPRFDSLMMSYLDKSRLFDPKFKQVVSAKAGIINPTILLDGFVQGIWRKEQKGKKLKITVVTFRKFSNRSKKAVEAKFAKYASHLELEPDLRYTPLN